MGVKKSVSQITLGKIRKTSPVPTRAKKPKESIECERCFCGPFDMDELNGCPNCDRLVCCHCFTGRICKDCEDFDGVAA